MSLHADAFQAERRRRRAAAPLVLFLLVFSRGASAHDWWLEPKSFATKPGSAVDVSGRVGVAFRGELVARDPKRIVRFDCTEGADRRPIDGKPGADPLGTFTPSRAGLAILAYQSTPATLFLRAPEFEDYLRLEGLESIVALRAQRGQSTRMGLERYVRCAKALLGASADLARPESDRALGLPLELVAERRPEDLRESGEFPVQLLFHEKPLAGALVVALERDHPDETISVRSDEQGRAVFALPRLGVWLIKAVHMVDAPKETRLDWESYWASLTFAIGADR